VPFNKKVVVVEDEDPIAHLVERVLGDAGYLCLRARDGEQALRMVRAEAPDLVILDVLMPKLDGIEVVRRLKNDPVLSRAPVLMLTSLASVDDRVRGLDAGADDYLPKPFDLRELVARVQSLVRLSRRERDRSPVTDLPGPGALDDAIEKRLERPAHFALLFVELIGFDGLIADFGWKRGEAVLRQVADGLRQSVEGEADALLTHLGGDDFVVVAASQDSARLTDVLRAAGARSAPDQLWVEVTAVDSGGARTVEDLALAVARARRVAVAAAD
jgi:DNA-binding response OmpR family regulator